MKPWNHPLMVQWDPRPRFYKGAVIWPHCPPRNDADSVPAEGDRDCPKICVKGWLSASTNDFSTAGSWWSSAWPAISPAAQVSPTSSVSSSCRCPRDLGLDQTEIFVRLRARDSRRRLRPSLYRPADRSLRHASGGPDHRHAPRFRRDRLRQGCRVSSCSLCCSPPSVFSVRAR